MDRMEFIVLSGDYYFYPNKKYAMKVGEYADVCEGETLTETSVQCNNATKIMKYYLRGNKKYLMSEIIQRLRKRFLSLDDFESYCNKNHIALKKLPLWVDNVSFNEYTGEHRGNFAPFK